MKHLRLLVALLSLIIWGGNLYAQTDVTTTYITNASFESDGSITASNGALTLTGWTQSDPGGSFNNTGCYNASANPPTQGTITVAPSAGDYYLFFRHGWNGNGANYTITSSTSTTLPAGAYTLSIDYKMVEGYDDTQKNTTSVTIAAVSGENTLGSDKGTTKTNVSGGNAYTYLKTADWSTASANFTLEEAIENVQFVITMFAGGQRRSDFVIDNVRLLFTEFIDPTEISLSATPLSMLPTAKETLTATLTPEDANHNTAITWTSSNESVATVADGVVTAVAAGTATITATTANGKEATCEVTVNEAPLANGDYYIMNVATNKYLGGANSWGTQASLIEHGIPFTATLANGFYTLDSHTYNKENEHFLTGKYVDGVSTNIYIVSMGDGKYSISTADGSAFLTANNENTVVANTATDATSELAQWKFVTKADRDALLKSATDANPADATYHIKEANISRNLRVSYGLSGWTGDFAYGQDNEEGRPNYCAERYKNVTDVYQTIESIPNGKYTVSVQGFFRQESGDAVSYLYANDESVALDQIQAGGINSMSAASVAFTNGEYKKQLVVYVTNGTLKVGIKCDAATNWTIWDNFELYYHGPSIGGEAVELADPMEAGKWYYFDLDFDGTYNLTATTLSDIVYTNDGTVLIENEGTVTTKFAGAENQQLTAGRYYVKSSSEQTFTIAPASYDYNLGEAVLSTADGGYTQSSTFTVTFPNAVTNDPEGALALVENSKATVNGAEVALTAAENGFTFELGTFAANTDFAIVIPAAVYGYADHSMNEAINITIHTPAVLDGFYFLRTSAGKYVARGGDYNSRAVVDEFGLPLSVATDASGITQFTYVDNGGKLFLNEQGNAYTDNSTDPNWIFEATEGGYYIVHADGTYANNKLNVWSGDNKSLFATGTEGTVFVIEPVSEHNTYMEALKDAQAAAAAAALGNEEITTKAALATWLDANYAATPVTVAEVAFTEKWNGAASAEWGAGKNMYTATVTNLPAGLYKLAVNAYYRINGSATAAEGARANVYLYGNDVKTQLYSIHDFPASEPWVSGNDQQDSYGYYPNNPTGGTAALSAGNYLNELYVYVSDGTLTYGIHQPSRFSNEQWLAFQNFTLTRYDKNVTIDEADYVDEAYTPVDEYASVTFKRTLVEGWNGLVLPFDMTVEDAMDKFNATAVKDFESVSYDAEKGATLNFVDATEIKAGKPFMLKAAAGTEYTFDGVQLKSDALQTISQENEDGSVKYTMTGTYQKVDLTNVNFVLIQGDKYYQHNTNKASSAKAFRAYFVNKSTGEAASKGINFNFGDETNGISLIEDAQNSKNGNIYNLQGQKVNHAQKGVYIVNGKKVVVK